MKRVRLDWGASGLRPESAFFDFDGTLSLIRTGWQSIMVPMMVEVLLECRTGEDIEEVRSAVRESVFRLTGKDTIYQMEELHRQVLERRGEPLPPLAYKSEYLRRLRQAIADRVNGLRRGTIDPDAMLVPGATRVSRNAPEEGIAPLPGQRYGPCRRARRSPLASD